MNKMKIFHDTVHGDISVPSSYCEEIIDTLLFQRLRRIEQTSMRSLYPCARHDRFIHSLGVFHLGKILVNSIQNNTKQMNAIFWDEIEPFWKKIYTSFELACLLHDIGHSPFSHTFEHFFDKKKERLKDTLKNTINDLIFNEDIDTFPETNPHEKISAYLAYTVFDPSISKLEGEPIYVVRMILGVLYLNPESLEQKIVNCLIPLLHGVIDVDRLDYAARDQWASGFSSVRIDVNRILTSGVFIKNEDDPYFCYYKNAVSQLEGLMDVKNFQSIWVFPHQKIQYDQDLLIKAVETMAENLKQEGESKEDIINAIFNLGVFENEEYSFKGINLYLLSDDDIIHLMKQTISQNSYAKEWLSRNHAKKPIWKTEAEYRQLFPNSAALSKTKIVRKIEAIEKTENKKINYEVLGIKKKRHAILANEIKLFINDKIIDYAALNLTDRAQSNTTEMFYIYLDSEAAQYKQKIIDDIKTIK